MLIKRCLALRGQLEEQAGRTRKFALLPGACRPYLGDDGTWLFSLPSSNSSGNREIISDGVQTSMGSGGESE